MNYKNNINLSAKPETCELTIAGLYTNIHDCF